MRYTIMAAATAAALFAAPAQAQYTVKEVAATTVVNQANLRGFGDDSTEAYSLGFDFDFYGNTYNTAVVSSNGFLAFSAQGSGCCSGQELGKDANTPNNLVAGLWLDLYPPSNQGISYGTTGAVGSRTFTVAYNGIQFYDTQGTGRTATFSMSLFEGSNNILINYNDLQVAGVNDFTSGGIENIDGTQGLGLFYGEAQTTAGAFSNRAFLIGTNLGGVPEPATWAMLLLGFGFLGGAMRQRKAAARIAYA